MSTSFRISKTAMRTYLMGNTFMEKVNLIQDNTTSSTGSKRLSFSAQSGDLVCDEPEVTRREQRERELANKHRADCGPSKLPRLALIRSRVGPQQALFSRGRLVFSAAWCLRKSSVEDGKRSVLLAVCQARDLDLDLDFSRIEISIPLLHFLVS